ncbi:glutamine synthetase family protein [Oceanicoccus sagamiensis]|uniref:Glutamine synthetase n=1 Tax=Oceanicoccus sagamiensis TaxID=716816 RepID=A0A1X9NQ17_9GAMM|nr:glutamine synthetase family protein [Oceanicoccus sagamiensis]ARN75953.1 glutamine synthetase [Oceanicoccus sagamiensis]
MNYGDAATLDELNAFLALYPDTEMMEVLSPDINGILRGKRIPREEFETFFTKGLKSPASSNLMNSHGDVPDELGYGMGDGDPDKIIYPIAGTLAPVPWLRSRPAQVIAGLRELNGDICYFDPRNILQRALEPLTAMGLKPVVATETEFYLIETGDDGLPQPLLPAVPGSALRQQGIQYGMMEDLWDQDEFLSAVKDAAKAQNLPMTTVLSEFSPGQLEINLHHNDDVLAACDQGVMFKRLIKGCARAQGVGASFMAKPFADIAGCGLHIHISLYDQQGNNIFADTASQQVPPVSEKMRHAVGGLAEIMADAMAIYSPNANSYRRLRPGNFAPLSPIWGYNHRAMSLRIPVSGAKDMRIEHRVAGADANPYLVMASLLAGIHHGLTQQCDPGAMVEEGTMMTEEAITLPVRWDAALQAFKHSQLLPKYLGEQYHGIYSLVKQAECDDYHAQVNPLDYQYYLRAV